MKIAKAKKTIKIISIIVLLVAVAGFGKMVVSKMEERKVSIITDNTKYETEGLLSVKIENNLEEPFCFSSQLPYFLQKKESFRWINYKYPKINTENDIIIRCIEPGELKAFELDLIGGGGIHRLAILVCMNCEIGQKFHGSRSFYSNEFIIN